MHPPTTPPPPTQAYFLRLALRFRVHWLRVLLSLLVLSCGGGTLAAMLQGRAAPWATSAGGGAVPAVLCAYALFFALGPTRGASRRDWAYRVYRVGPLRDAWQLVASLQVALAGSAAAEAARLGGLPLATQGLLGVVGGCGGSLLAEAWDLLLQGPSRYAHPIHGPGPGVVLCVWGTALFVALRACVPEALLPFVAARGAVVVCVAAANYLIPGRALARGSSAALERLLPGFAGIWDPPTGSSEAAAAAAVVAEHAALSWGRSKVAVGEAATAARAAEDAVHAAAVEAEELASPPPWPLDAGLFGYEVASLREVHRFAHQEGSRLVSPMGVGDGSCDADDAATSAARVTPTRRRRASSRGK